MSTTADITVAQWLKLIQGAAFRTKTQVLVPAHVLASAGIPIAPACYGPVGDAHSAKGATLSIDRLRLGAGLKRGRVRLERLLAGDAGKPAIGATTLPDVLESGPVTISGEVSLPGRDRPAMVAWSIKDARRSHPLCWFLTPDIDPSVPAALASIVHDEQTWALFTGMFDTAVTTCATILENVAASRDAMR